MQGDAMPPGMLPTLSTERRQTLCYGRAAGGEVYQPGKDEGLWRGLGTLVAPLRSGGPTVEPIDAV